MVQLFFDVRQTSFKWQQFPQSLIPVFSEAEYLLHYGSRKAFSLLIFKLRKGQLAPQQMDTFILQLKITMSIMVII